MRDELLTSLAGMARFLERAARRCSGAKLLEPGPDGGFCFLDQVWHLADLEACYGERIRRIRDEERPALVDFDGAAVAREGRYRERSLPTGLAAFRRARTGNLRSLRALSETEWARPATQEGVGELRLEDVPRMMAGHDASHRAEIRALLGEAPASEAPPRSSSRMVQALGLLLLLPLLGCPYASSFPLGEAGAAPRDERLLGAWRCVSGSGEKAVRMDATALGPAQYRFLVASPGEKTIELVGHVSSLTGVLNVHDNESERPGPSWNFARYALPNRDAVSFELAEDELLKTVERTPAALQAALQGPKRDAIFEPFLVCARIQEDKASR